MNKSQLSEAVGKATGLSKKQSINAVNAVTELIAGELRRSGKVSLTGFGTFDVATRRARVGVNPRTGQRINIPATKVARFRAGKELKNMIK